MFPDQYGKYVARGLFVIEDKDSDHTVVFIIGIITVTVVPAAWPLFTIRAVMIIEANGYVFLNNSILFSDSCLPLDLWLVPPSLFFFIEAAFSRPIPSSWIMTSR